MKTVTGNSDVVEEKYPYMIEAANLRDILGVIIDPAPENNAKDSEDTTGISGE